MGRFAKPTYPSCCWRSGKLEMSTILIANLKVIRKKSEIRDRLVFTWALPRLEYEEVDMLLGWL